VAGHLLFETLGIAEAQDDDLGAFRAVSMFLLIPQYACYNFQDL
jgi:hypothetical protein